jgi:hypothetical protein
MGDGPIIRSKDFGYPAKVITPKVRVPTAMAAAFARAAYEDA